MSNSYGYVKISTRRVNKALDKMEVEAVKKHEDKNKQLYERNKYRPKRFSDLSLKQIFTFQRPMVEMDPEETREYYNSRLEMFEHGEYRCNDDELNRSLNFISYIRSLTDSNPKDETVYLSDDVMVRLRNYME